MWLFLQEGALLIVARSVLGAAGAFALSRALSPLDPDCAQVPGSLVGDRALLVGAQLLLVATALLACAGVRLVGSTNQPCRQSDRTPGAAGGTPAASLKPVSE